MPRRVTLVLCSPHGRLLGAPPAYDVASPWWPDVGPVVEAARARFGLGVTVLRVLRTTARGPQGGEGAYLAETTDDVDRLACLLAEPAGDLRGPAEAEDPLRQPWARPGGVAADTAWADAELGRAGLRRTGPAVQVKSWNLSSVLRLPTGSGPVWCKHVPSFLRHEGAVLEAVGRTEPDLVPPLLARRDDDDATSVTLLGHVAGEDQWEAPVEVLTTMARRWTEVQSRWADEVDELLSLGVPDRRSPALADALAALLRRPDVRRTLTGAELDDVDAVVAALPDRLAALDGCGLPPTLVHGDLHPGNWIGDGQRLTLVDWGDSVVGHPMLDVHAFLERLPPGAVREQVHDVFVEGWARARPGADVEQAVHLVAPVVALWRALVYRGFLDRIEATERDYHESDVPAMLRLAVSLALSRDRSVSS